MEIDKVKILKRDDNCQHTAYALVFVMPDIQSRSKLFGIADAAGVPLGGAQYPLLHRQAWFMESGAVGPDHQLDKFMVDVHKRLVVMPLPMQATENQILNIASWLSKSVKSVTY